MNRPARIVLLLCLAFASPAFADYPVTLIATWGSLGSADGQFNKPVAVAVSPLGEVYVLEDGNGRVQVFAPDGTFLRKWGSVGAAQGQFTGPTGIAIGSDGNVFTTETGRSRIQRLTADGQYLASFGGVGSSTYLDGIAADNAGHLFVCVAGNFSSIRKCNLDGSSATGMSAPVAFWPLCVTLDASGNVLSGQSQNVIKFSSAGTYLGLWVPGSGAQIPVTHGIAVDGDGHVFTTDGYNHRVNVADAAGINLGSFGSLGDGPLQFNLPKGIAISPINGYIYITEYYNNRVDVYAPTPTPARPQTWGRIKADYR